MLPSLVALSEARSLRSRSTRALVSVRVTSPVVRCRPTVAHTTTEYFEHATEAIFCGEVCLAVFRLLAGLPIAPIWKFTDVKLEESNSLYIVYGCGLGLLGAGIGYCFANFHTRVMGTFTRWNLMETKNAVPRALLGAIVVVSLGMMIPHTMFWGEYEIQALATLSPATSLDHIWPTSGLFGFEMNSFASAFLVGVTKLVAISFTVAGGYRGGYIFPAFASATAFGRAVYFVCPFIPVQLCVLCTAAALNVALTRTALATTLILAFLAGEQNSISAVLASSLMSLFVTGYMPFIKSQIARSDLSISLYHADDQPTVYENHEGQEILLQNGDTPMSDMHKTPALEGRKLIV